MVLILLMSYLLVTHIYAYEYIYKWNSIIARTHVQKIQEKEAVKVGMTKV